MKCYSAFFISIVPTPGRQGNAFLFWFWILWQFHCSVLMTQHVFCVALHAYLCLWMTAANTWSTASIRLCQVLMLRPRKPVTVWNFFSSFTFRSSPTEEAKGSKMLPLRLAIPSLSGCSQFIFSSPKLCTCPCLKHCSVLVPEVGAEELGSAWQSLFLTEDHGVLMSANKTNSQSKPLNVKLGTHRETTATSSTESAPLNSLEQDGHFACEILGKTIAAFRGWAERQSV